MKYEKNKFYDKDDNEIDEVKGFFTEAHRFTGVYCDIHGNTYFYNDGVFHNDDDLPSIIMVNGDKHWYDQGVRHREGFPATIYSDVDKPDEYYYNGTKINLEEILKTVQNNVDKG